MPPRTLPVYLGFQDWHRRAQKCGPNCVQAYPTQIIQGQPKVTWCMLQPNQVPEANIPASKPCSQTSRQFSPRCQLTDDALRSCWKPHLYMLIDREATQILNTTLIEERNRNRLNDDSTHLGSIPCDTPRQTHTQTHIHHTYHEQQIQLTQKTHRRLDCSPKRCFLVYCSAPKIEQIIHGNKHGSPIHCCHPGPAAHQQVAFMRSSAFCTCSAEPGPRMI
jgi:hypothetical protein